MREIVDKLYTFLLNMESAESVALRDYRSQETWEWDRPREDPGLMKQMEVVASGIVEDAGKAPSPQRETEAWPQERRSEGQARTCGRPQPQSCGPSTGQRAAE